MSIDLLETFLCWRIVRSSVDDIVVALVDDRLTLVK